jgi:cytidyltransferase-like protein
MITVLVFGAFDGLHEGHRNFLSQAKKLGDHLAISIASDKAIQQLKGHAPRFSAEERKTMLKKEGFGDSLMIGDTDLGNWTAIKKFKPDIVALGYDQKDLYEALLYDKDQFPFLKKIERLHPHQGETLHSSMLK